MADTPAHNYGKGLAIFSFLVVALCFVMGWALRVRLVHDYQVVCMLLLARDRVI
jgi:hypothetical protein